MILGSVPDCGRGNAQRHSLLDMAVIALAALVCGAGSRVDFAEFAAIREELLQEFLALRMGCRTMTPSAACPAAGPAGLRAGV